MEERGGGLEGGSESEEELLPLPANYRIPLSYGTFWQKLLRGAFCILHHDIQRG